MSNENQLKAIPWLAYRVIRRWWYTATGRNPLARGNSGPSIGFEWRSIQGLLKSKADAARKIRQDGEFALWSTSLGELWTPSGASEDYVGMLIGEMNALVYDLSALPSNGAATTIIDAGANVGVFARWAFGQGAEKVVCFEPSPRNADCLRRNLEKEIAVGRAVVVEKGLWDVMTTMSFSSSNEANPGSHHIAEGGEGNMSIELTTLDDSIQELGVDRVDYIKMDVEGAEQRALMGARKTIAKFQPQMCVVVEHTSDLCANAQAVISQITAGSTYGYRATEVHVSVSPSRGKVLTPYSLLFIPGNRPFGRNCPG